jgi:hypothetical protein
MVYRKQNSIEFHKTKSEMSIFSKKKRKLFFYTVTLQQEEEVYVEKQMKSKKGDEKLDLH